MGAAPRMTARGTHHGERHDPLLGRGEGRRRYGGGAIRGQHARRGAHRARETHTQRPEFARVLLRCSFLVDGDPVGTREHEAVRLPEGGTVEVLPPFAGGAR